MPHHTHHHQGRADIKLVSLIAISTLSFIWEFFNILPQTTKSGLVPFLELSTLHRLQENSTVQVVFLYRNQLAKQHFKWQEFRQAALSHLNLELMLWWVGGPVSLCPGAGWCPTKSATKQASSNCLVDPSSRFHRSCHVGRRSKGRLSHKNCLLLSSSVRTWMTWPGRQADRKLSWRIVV